MAIISSDAIGVIGMKHAKKFGRKGEKSYFYLLFMVHINDRADESSSRT